MRMLERPVHPARRRVELGAADACRETVTALTRENERLRAELRAREQELRSSRARIVQAADAARRRLERDLHDGAQQRLVAFALDLRRLLARLEGTDVAPVVAQLGDELAAALAELRELARGIHPVVLTDRGLAPALQGLADRAPLPVLVDVEAIGRPRPHVEAAAYFVVAEALTNVARHAEAGEAHVEVRRRGEHLVVTVTDDGVGGLTRRGAQDCSGCATASPPSKAPWPSTARRGPGRDCRPSSPRRRPPPPRAPPASRVTGVKVMPGRAGRRRDLPPVDRLDPASGTGGCDEPPVRSDEHRIQRLGERHVHGVPAADGGSQLPCSREEGPVTETLARPGLEILDRLGGRCAVQAPMQVLATDDAEDLDATQRGRDPRGWATRPPRRGACRSRA
jgi:Histidine kinase/Histidine kinase-, DNA gyrase B-, and HSP90-like ATPase